METALITGASGGIGSAVARQLALDGYAVVLNYCHNEAAAEAAAAEIRQQGGIAHALYADVSRAEEVERLFAQIEDLGLRLALLVNNAGIAYSGLLYDMTEADWDRLFAVNCKGAFLCSRAALSPMLLNGGGSIVNISSMWGRSGASCEVAYSATKAAIIGFSRALAKELAPSDIRVNCIAPGVIDTAMNGRLSEADLAALAEQTPLGRLGTPQEVAYMVSFLADRQKAGFITGQVFGVDGGFII